MGLFEDIAEGIKRAVTLPSRYNSLSDVARDPIGAITSAAQTAFNVAGVAGGFGVPVSVPGWVEKVAQIGGMISQFKAVRDAQRLADAMLANMQGTSRNVQAIIAALNTLPPPQPVAPRMEQVMRANLQVALEQARRYAPVGVDMSGVLNLMNARGLAQIANAYNQQAMRDTELARQDMLNRLQMQAGMWDNVYQMQQGMYGLAMQRQQILQQGIANALLTFSQMFPARRLNPQATLAQQLSMQGAGTLLSAVGQPAAGASLWQMARGGR